MEFTGKVVLVTGAAKGMGFGCATKFANEDASVALVDIDSENLLKVEKDLKIMNNFLKDLEQLSSNLLKWNQGVIENYKIKIQQLNES